MLFFLVTGISFFFFFLNSLSLKPLPPWANDVRLLPLCFWKVLSFSPICKALKQGIFGVFCRFPSIMAIKQGTYSSKFENLQGSVQLSILDLPELALDCILEKLPPSELCRMAAVCSSLRERCISDHLWERHMNQKWGKVIGLAASREWQWFVACRRNFSSTTRKKSQSLVKFICKVWPFSWFTSKFDKANYYNHKDSASPLVDSVMSWYLALESGKFWFPAQVYNRENGHVGFVLSCYDAELSYDSQRDTFQARYPPHGRRAVAIESGIQWERLRAAPVNTPPHDLHPSNCLNDLHPGDHIEIQWRRNKEFPYGWWYGVVSHLESCDGNENYCRCYSSDTVLFEFSQYTLGSRWRKTIVSRKDHREEGNESDGFYGGIRKLYHCHEIATWKNMWPKEILD